MVDQKIIEEFVEQIKPDNKESNKTHSAIVSKIDEEGTVWVRVAGSDKDTPTALVGAEVKKGDAVNVEWRNNKLYIASNYSNPAAGVGRVGAVEQAAQLANEAANNAITDAGRAKEAADSASASADQAKQDAAEAETAAATANTAATGALTGLSTVQDVIGMLNWAAENATYSLTQDTDIMPGKTYWTRSGAGTAADPYVYTPVPNPVKTALNTYYEITGMDEAMGDFINAHLAVTSRGLWVLPNGMGTGTTPASGETQQDSDARQGADYKALLSNNGMEIYDGSGVLVAKYGTSIEFDSGREHTIGNQNSYIKYYDDNGTFKIEVKADEVVFKGDDLDTIISDGGRITTGQILASYIESNGLYINSAQVNDLDELLGDKQDAGDYMTNDEYDDKIKDIAALFNTLNGQIVFGDDGTNTYILLQNHAKGNPDLVNGIQAKLTAGKLAFGTFGQTDNEVAYFSSEELKVQKRLSFGNFVMKQRDNGHLSIMYEGGDD